MTLNAEITESLSIRIQKLGTVKLLPRPIANPGFQNWSAPSVSQIMVASGSYSMPIFLRDHQAIFEGDPSSAEAIVNSLTDTMMNFKKLAELARK